MIWLFGIWQNICNIDFEFKSDGQQFNELYFW